VTIASNTLRTHVRRILEKTGMHSRAEFVAKALGRQKTSDLSDQ
jgi:DNA-binding CsgD family transcriptional regulator